MKKILNLLILASMCIATVFCITSCSEEPVYADYKISVVDALGKPIPNVVATFTDVEGNTKKTIVQKDGTATFKNFMVGENTLLLEKGLSDADIMQEKYTFEKGVTEMRVVLRNEKTAVDIYGEIEDGCYAYEVGVGNQTVLTTAGNISYVVFTAPSAGIYEFSFNSADTDMIIAYYGMPMYVQTSHRADGAYDGKKFELVIHDVSAPYVIGLDCKNTADSTLVITRKGDAPFDPEYMPWTVKTPTENFKHYTTCSLSKLTVKNSDGEFIDFLMTPVSLENENIGFNGTYKATDSKGNTKNIVITSETVTIDSESYNYSIKNGVPTLLDKNNEPIETTKFSVSGEVVDLDISDPALSVTKGSDGYYYTADGKLVYLRISSASVYFDAPIALLAGFMDQNIGGNFGGYVYDAEGNYLDKYSFNDMVGEYYEYADANGVYPLTEEMVEAITVHAEYRGWWEPGNQDFIFGDKSYIKENAWLFLCCTEK